MCLRLGDVLVAMVMVVTISRAQGATTHPAIQGSTANLVCDQDGSNIFWQLNGIVLSINADIQPNVDANKFVIKIENGRYVLSIRDVALADEATYKCHNFGATEQEVNLVVLVSPSPLIMSRPTTTVDEGAEMLYECVSSGGKPLPVFTWLLTDFRNNASDVTQLSTIFDDIDADGTGTRRSVLTLNAARYMQRGTISCVASSPPLIYQESNSRTIEMNLTPLPPTITGNDVSVNVGSSVEFTCHGNGAKPKATLSWKKGSQSIAGRVSVTTGADGTHNVSSTIVVQATREDDEAVYSCEIVNDVMTRSNILPYETNTTLLLNYLPEVAVSILPKTFTEGNDVTINCTIDSRPPAFNISWILNGKSLDLGKSRYSVVEDLASPSLTIRAVNRFDVGVYNCRGTNKIGTGTSQDTSLDIYHRPACKEDQQLRFGVAIGSKARLHCSVYSNPNNATFHFKRNGQYFNFFGIKDPMNKYHSSATYEYVVGSASDYGTVECNVTNVIGAILKPCVFRVEAPGPAEAPQNCRASNVTATTVNIECEAGFDGGATQHFTLTQQTSSVFVLLQNRTSPVYFVENLQPSVTNSFRVCSSSVLFPDDSSCAELKVTTESRPNEVVTMPQAGAVTLRSQDIYILAGVGGALVLLVIIGTIAGCIYKNKTKKKSKSIQKTRDNVYIEPRMEGVDNKTDDLELEMSNAAFENKEEGIGEAVVDINDIENVIELDETEKTSRSDDGYSSVRSQTGAYVMAVEINEELAPQDSANHQDDDNDTLDASVAMETVVNDVGNTASDDMDTCVNPVYDSKSQTTAEGTDNPAFENEATVLDSDQPEIVEDGEETEGHAAVVNDNSSLHEKADSSSDDSSSDSDSDNGSKDGEKRRKKRHSVAKLPSNEESKSSCSTNRESEIDIGSVEVKITESPIEESPDESHVTIEIKDVPKQGESGAFF